MNTAIPKTIHCCWFGRGKQPELVERCMKSWKEYCPNYEIKLWTEDNYDVSKNQYMYEAYLNKKWAFASDYARLDILYEHGGIYLDVDVELIKNLDPLLSNRAVMGFEQGKFISTGLICAAVPRHKAIAGLLELYNHLSFINEDGSLNLTPCPKYTTEFFLSKGLIQNNKLQICEDVTMFPLDYFDPCDFLSKELKLTENSYSIHHAAMTWHDDSSKKQIEFERRIYKKYGRSAWRMYHAFNVLRFQGLGELLVRLRQSFKK